MVDGDSPTARTRTATAAATIGLDKARTDQNSGLDIHAAAAAVSGNGSGAFASISEIPAIQGDVFCRNDNQAAAIAAIIIIPRAAAAAEVDRISGVTIDGIRYACAVMTAEPSITPAGAGFRSRQISLGPSLFAPASAAQIPSTGCINSAIY